jgi:hypothetical protein
MMRPQKHLTLLGQDSTFDELVEAVTRDMDEAKTRINELHNSDLFHKNDSYVLTHLRDWADLRILHRHLVRHKDTYGV